MSRADIAAMKSLVAASTRWTSASCVFCCPTAPPVGTIIVNITVAIAATIAGDIAGIMSFFGGFIVGLLPVGVNGGERLRAIRGTPYDPGHTGRTGMSIYEKLILPRLLDLAMGN